MSVLADYREVLMGDPCAYCGEPTEHIDHIDARANGGEDAPSNLTPACAACNLSKSTLELLPFLLRKQDPKAAPAPRKPRAAKPPWSFETNALCTDASVLEATFVFPGARGSTLSFSCPAAGARSQAPIPGDVYRLSLTQALEAA